MKKIVIIGANDFQRPLIQKAGELGYETHVFAWREGATGAADADYFYEISITEKQKILEICREIKPDAVATIGSDLANVTVQYLAEQLGLPGNSSRCILYSTNKYEMRRAFQRAGLPVPWFQVVREGEIICPPVYPVVVKPTDRSGSRAITEVEQPEELEAAVKNAIDQSFEKRAIVEEYISGREYSVETISFEGNHTCLAITKKFTTGEPNYIEVGHLQPAPLSRELQQRVKQIVFSALNALEVRYGAAHSEVRIDETGRVRIIEIGSRMGGDCIGSDLVPLSTGQDYVKMVLDTALGREPVLSPAASHVSAIRFLMNERELRHLRRLEQSCPEYIRKVVLEGSVKDAKIVDSGTRPGFYILQTQTREEMEELLHEGPEGEPVKLARTPIRKLKFTDGENQFYMKRDDLQPFSIGGNIVRFAKAYGEDMREKHCDSMVVCGDRYSNLCTVLAEFCRTAQIPCTLICDTEEEERRADRPRKVRRAMIELEEMGYRPYYVFGNEQGQGNAWVPVRSYAEAYHEICVQEREMGEQFDCIFLSCGLCLTQSGLLAGSMEEADGRRIIGISVRETKGEAKKKIIRNLQEYAGKFGIKFPEGYEDRITVEDDWLEGSYGSFSLPVENRIRQLYESDGIALDMTNTGKAFDGMLKYLEKYKIRNKKILFLNTGGIADLGT